jgi:hypothetical protein
MEVQSGSGDLERPANVQNRVAGIIELLGNAALLHTHRFGSAAFFPSGTSGNKASSCPLFDQVSLKLR